MTRTDRNLHVENDIDIVREWHQTRNIPIEICYHRYDDPDQFRFYGDPTRLFSIIYKNPEDEIRYGDEFHAYYDSLQMDEDRVQMNMVGKLPKR